jgi:putative membrane protein
MRTSNWIFASALLLATGGVSAQDAAPAAAGPTDAQIAHIVVTANQVDIDAGRLAESKAHSKDVRAFGKTMVTDHSGVNQQAVALATRLKVTPEDNPTSQSLKMEGADNVATLKGLKGGAFDKAYIDHEIAYHEQVLEAIDKVLVPNANNAELKALIVKVRPAFVAHLEHAKTIQAKLPG